MIILWFILVISYCKAFPEDGVFNVNLNKSVKSVQKTVYAGAYVDLLCDGKRNTSGIKIEVRVAYSSCLGQLDCRNDAYVYNFGVDCSSSSSSLKYLSGNSSVVNATERLRTTEDGTYAFCFQIISGSTELPAKILIRNSYGYLSAVEWPLLIFYSVMCAVYSVFALLWLAMSFRNWRDLLRIQFWIGGVIFLGMLEKALFVAEYQSINSTGITMKYGMLTAEIVSCIKRTLSRILLMIVCIGYGIVKPRLGPALRKIIGVGFAYLIAAMVEGCIRIMYPKIRSSKYMFIPEISLVIIDTLILWWSFTYLIQTIKQMRIRHNIVKFNLYRHFSNILIIVVITSVLFMGWALYVFRTTNCIVHWRELWVNDAFWHVLFSIVLLTIMILWRPSKNSQRYAYSPLLDEEDLDLDDDEQEITLENFTSGELKKAKKDNENQRKSDKTAEDDLKWIEENIPASAAEKIYPLVDSDEELTPSKIQSGKMD